MIWLICAVLGPVLWGICIILDTMNRQRFIKDDMSITFLAILGRVPIALILIAVTHPFSGKAGDIAMLVLGGLLYTLPLLLYYRALQDQSASAVAVLEQSVPAFVVLGAFAFIGERLSVSQIVAFILMLAAGTLASMKSGEKLKMSISILLMLVACICWAVANLLFKAYSVSFSSFWDAYTVYFTGQALSATIFAMVIRKKGGGVIKTLKSIPAKGFIIMAWALGLAILATAAYTYAICIGSVSLTSVLMGLQPISAFLLSWPLARLFSDIPKEEVGQKTLVFKGVAFALVIISLVLLEQG